MSDVDNEHPQIDGHRVLDADEVDLINNTIKGEEAEVADLVRRLQEHALQCSVVEGSEALRHLALARAAFEVGFMHAVRAVARPLSPWVRPTPDRE
jgi:hypothetical protein